MHRHQFVNGTRILKTGFTYDHPTLTKDLLKEVGIYKKFLLLLPPLICYSPVIVYLAVCSFF